MGDPCQRRIEARMNWLLLCFVLTGCERCGWQESAIGATAESPGARGPRLDAPVENSVGDPLELAEITWVLGGRSLLVNRHWLLDPEAGLFFPLPYSATVAERGSLVQFQMSLTSDRESVLVGDGGRLRFGPVTGPLGEEVKIPQWQEKAGSPDGAITVLSWVSNQHILAQRFMRLEDDSSCIILDVRTHSWSDASSCLSAAYSLLGSIITGPDGWLAAYSYTEGAEALSLVRYDPFVGQRDVEAPQLEPAPYAPIVPHFTHDKLRILFVTPCPIVAFQSQCTEETNEETGSFLYSWRVGTRQIVLERSGLPPGTAPHPSGLALAWAEPGQVCVGDPAARKAARCFALPPW